MVAQVGIKGMLGLFQEKEKKKRIRASLVVQW